MKHSLVTEILTKYLLAIMDIKLKMNVEMLRNISLKNMSLYV